MPDQREFVRKIPRTPDSWLEVWHVQLDTAVTGDCSHVIPAGELHYELMTWEADGEFTKGTHHRTYCAGCGEAKQAESMARRLRDKFNG